MKPVCKQETIVPVYQAKKRLHHSHQLAKRLSSFALFTVIKDTRIQSTLIHTQRKKHRGGAKSVRNKMRQRERDKKKAFCNLCASDDIIGLNLLCRHRAILANASRRLIFNGPLFSCSALFLKWFVAFKAFFFLNCSRKWKTHFARLIYPIRWSHHMSRTYASPVSHIKFNFSLVACF